MIESTPIGPEASSVAEEPGEKKSIEEIALGKLHRIAAIIAKEVPGFKVAERFLNLDMLNSRAADGGVPFDDWGLGDVRWSYRGFRDRQTGLPNGRLTVWFTNSYEKMDNPDRVAVTNRLEAEGLMKPGSYEIILSDEGM